MSARKRAWAVKPGDPGFPFPPWQRPIKPTRARSPLSRDRIVEVALGIIDAEGTEAVTMRRIATELDTGPASLYAHVAGKDEVLQLAWDRVIGEMRLPESAGGDWSDEVRAWAWEVYRTYARHSDLARLSLADIPTGPHALDMSERLLRAMIDGGVPPQLAAWALDRISLYVAADAFEGWLLTQKFAGEQGRSSVERGAEWFAQVRDYMASLPVERFPTMVQHVDVLMSGGGERRFEIGLDVLIAGVRSLAEQWDEHD